MLDRSPGAIHLVPHLQLELLQIRAEHLPHFLGKSGEDHEPVRFHRDSILACNALEPCSRLQDSVEAIWLIVASHRRWFYPHIRACALRSSSSLPGTGSGAKLPLGRLLSLKTSRN
jgi:hypothetical protein